VFVYAAKLTVSKSTAFSEDFQGVYPEQIETHHCPFCQSLDLAEYVEPQQTPTSAVQVDWAEVDAKLKEGYVIVKDYQKNATMFKYAKEEVSEK